MATSTRSPGPAEGFAERLDDLVRRAAPSRSGGPLLWVKGAALLAAWGVVGWSLVSGPHGAGALLALHAAWALLGVSVALNVGHDAVHGVAAGRRWVNGIAGWTFALVGLSPEAWRIKHNERHHAHPNAPGLDFDVELRPFLRAVPAQERRPFHRWQHLYAPALYLLAALALIVVVDLRVLAATRPLGRPGHAGIWLRALAVKLGYGAAVLGAPVWLGGSAPLPNALAWLAAAGLMGWAVALVFLPAHLFEGVGAPAPDAPWAERQARTTLDVAPESALVTHLTGGLNLNVVHHLVPALAHPHLPRLRPGVEALLGEAGLPYHRASLGGAVVRHLRHLRRLGAPEGR